MNRFSARNLAWCLGIASILFSACGAQAQNIGNGNLSLSIDGASVLNGFPSATGASVITGTALTGTIQVTGVSGNQGSTEVICTEQLTGAQLIDWTTNSDGGTSFTWTPTTAANYQIICSGSWSGFFVNGTVYTGTATVPATGPITTFDPVYKVVSILYSPPGNQSSNGFTNTTTNGSVTTLGDSFSSGSNISFNVSGVLGLFGFSASFGSSTTTSNSTAFTETFSNATSVATDDNGSSYYNPSQTNAINHNLDTFLILLNPEVAVSSTGPDGLTPYSYSVGFKPINGIQTAQADIVRVPAIDLETGNVAVNVLAPQPIGSPVDGQQPYMPGLGAICKNNAAYVSNACTQANQCGCVASDFADILAQDPLLNYNGTGQPYDGTVSPLEADTSGAANCLSPNSSSQCRYVIVPDAPQSTTPVFQQLSGSTANSFTQTDGNSTSQTLGETRQYTLSTSSQGGFLVGSLTRTNTWTWQDSESVGSSTGTANSMSVTLKTSTPGCEENVNLYEDTIYHTFVYQIPTGITGCP
jgi:hypothetical protein